MSRTGDSGLNELYSPIEVMLMQCLLFIELLCQG